MAGKYKPHRIEYIGKGQGITSSDVQQALLRYRAEGGRITKLAPSKEPERVWVNPKAQAPKFESAVPEHLLG